AFDYSMMIYLTAKKMFTQETFSLNYISNSMKIYEGGVSPVRICPWKCNIRAMTWNTAHWLDIFGET
ncbi:MAG: hypothetical protein IK079_04815, partial [Desulfovibrio sp.]|nr:hypothetical protein [Desulfovibrio sp.]